MKSFGFSIVIVAVAVSASAQPGDGFRGPNFNRPPVDPAQFGGTDPVFCPSRVLEQAAYDVHGELLNQVCGKPRGNDSGGVGIDRPSIRLIKE